MSSYKTYAALVHYANHTKSDNITVTAPNVESAVGGVIRQMKERGIEPITVEEIYPLGNEDNLDTPATVDNINHPKHYNTGKFEVIDVIEDWKLNFNLGNAVKYIARAEHKGKVVEDLKKAEWYLRREIEKREKEENKSA